MDATQNLSIFDANRLSALKRQTAAGDPAAIKATARQFEALFLQQVLKTMRQASPQQGLMESESTRFYQALLDQQMAQVVSARGGVGLASAIQQQMERQSMATQLLSGVPPAPPVEGVAGP